MEQSLEEVQEEIKVLKNEIKETLTDIRDYLLTHVQNPFAQEARPESPPPRRTGIEREEMSSGGEKGQKEPDDSLPPAEETSIAQERPHPGHHRRTDGLGNPLTAPQQQPVGQAPPPQPVYQPPPPPQPVSELHPGPQPSAEQGPFTAELQARASMTGPGQYPTEHRGLQDHGPRVSQETHAAFQDGRATGHARQKGSETGPIVNRRDPLWTGQAPAADRRREELPDRHLDGVDLLTLTTLASWAQDGIRKIGQDHLRTMVEIYDAMGHLAPQTKEVLNRLIGLERGDGVPADVSVKDCIHVLSDLDNILWRRRFESRGPAPFYRDF